MLVKHIKLLGTARIQPRCSFTRPRAEDLVHLLTREVARPTVAEVLDRAARRSERATASALEALDEARSGRDEQPRRQLPTT